LVKEGKGEGEEKSKKRRVMRGGRDSGPQRLYFNLLLWGFERVKTQKKKNPTTKGGLHGLESEFLVCFGLEPFFVEMGNRSRIFGAKKWKGGTGAGTLNSNCELMFLDSIMGRGRGC